MSSPRLKLRGTRQRASRACACGCGKALFRYKGEMVLVCRETWLLVGAEDRRTILLPGAPVGEKRAAARRVLELAGMIRGRRAVEAGDKNLRVWGESVEFPKTEPSHDSMFPAVACCDEAPEGPGTTANKPLMRKREALQSEARGDRDTAGNTFVGWVRNGLPDSDTTVLVRIEDEESPIWPGFHDGEAWRHADASLMELRVLGWMELEAAAKVLDGKDSTK